MKNEIIFPRHIDKEVGLAALSTTHSTLFYKWLNDGRIHQGMGDIDIAPFGIQDSKEYLSRHLKDTWLVVFRDSQKWIPIGYTGLFVRKRHRVGILRYAIGEIEYEGRGIATRVVRLMSKWAFDDLDLVSIHASVAEFNLSSSRVLQKNSFVQVGKYSTSRFESGQRYDELLFELVRKKE